MNQSQRLTQFVASQVITRIIHHRFISSVNTQWADKSNRMKWTTTCIHHRRDNELDVDTKRWWRQGCNVSLNELSISRAVRFGRLMNDGRLLGFLTIISSLDSWWTERKQTSNKHQRSSSSSEKFRRFRRSRRFRLMKNEKREQKEWTDRWKYKKKRREKTERIYQLPSSLFRTLFECVSR